MMRNAHFHENGHQKVFRVMMLAGMRQSAYKVNPDHSCCAKPDVKSPLYVKKDDTCTTPRGGA